MRAFQSSSSSSSFRTFHARSISKVAVLGSGLMGSGIVQVSAQSNFHVTLFDLNEGLLEKARANISKSLARVASKKFKDDAAAAEKFQQETLGRIVATSDINAAVGEADLVVEAIVENLKIKQDLFADIDKIAPSSAIFASNTSSLPITDISNGTRADKFVGLHFFNPVPVMKLVEVISLETTSNETKDAVVKFGEAVGKSVVHCKDTPGFIVNRLLVPYMVDAVRMWERGDATTKDIDTAMKLGCGYPMGPFELSDYVGIDTIKFILDGWHSRYPNEPQFKPVESINKLVKEGKLGMKSGEGFYKYDKK